MKVETTGSHFPLNLVRTYPKVTPVLVNDSYFFDDRNISPPDFKMEYELANA